jgi:arsenate reductase
MKDVKFYWLPNCSTCKKAAGWLERRGVEITEFRDIKSEPLSRSEIEALIKMLGGAAEDLFSKRAIKYREMKLNERDLSNEEMIELMTDEYTFLKRPVMVIDGRAVAGFFERSYIAFLDDHYFPKITKADTDK